MAPQFRSSCTRLVTGRLYSDLKYCQKSPIWGKNGENCLIKKELSSEQLRKPEKMKQFGQSNPSKKYKIGHILLIFPTWGRDCDPLCATHIQGALSSAYNLRENYSFTSIDDYSVCSIFSFSALSCRSDGYEHYCMTI